VPVVRSNFEIVRSRLMWVLVLKTCRDAGVGPCEVCDGHGSIGQYHQGRLFGAVICSGCRGLGFDLSALPDGGVAYDFWGFQDVEQDIEVGIFYEDAESFYKKEHDPMTMRFVDRHNPEWDRMWALVDPTSTKEPWEVLDLWQYMGTELQGDQWVHLFQSRDRSPTDERKTVPANYVPTE